MLDKNQIDIPYFNRWVHKINSDNISLNGLLELLASKELEDEDSSFYPTPVKLFRGMIIKFLGIGVIENPVVIDYVAGRGTSLITLLEMYKEKGIEVDTSNIYYNDIDPYMVKIFKKINKEYNLGIPEENIFNEDVLNPSQKFKEILMKEFDYVLINPPFSKNSKEPVRQWSKFIDLGRTLRKHSGGLGVFSPSTLLSSTNSIHDEIKGEMIYTNVSSEVSDSFTSRGGSQKFIYSIFMDSKVNKCVTKFDEVELEFNPTSTPIAPIKSSSYFIYDLVEKLYNSNFPVHDWYRVDVKEVDSAVVVPMAKAISFKVQFMDSDDFEIGRYKLKISKEFGENIAHNLNTKIYRILRWVLRSGPALAGNFKLLPIPIVKINDEELFDKLNLDKPTREYIKNYVE
jgi:predicted RNA methylase